MSFSMNHGGMAPRLFRSAVRALMARAQGRASSYVSSDIGATDAGRWHCWQLRWRMGATSLAKVTSPAAADDWPFAATGARRMTATKLAARIPRRDLLFIGELLFRFQLKASYSIPPQSDNCNREIVPPDGLY